MAELHVYYMFKLSILIEKNKLGNLATVMTSQSEMGRAGNWRKPSGDARRQQTEQKIGDKWYKWSN